MHFVFSLCADRFVNYFRKLIFDFRNEITPTVNVDVNSVVVPLFGNYASIELHVLIIHDLGRHFVQFRIKLYIKFLRMATLFIRSSFGKFLKPSVLRLYKFFCAFLSFLSNFSFVRPWSSLFLEGYALINYQPICIRCN